MPSQPDSAIFAALFIYMKTLLLSIACSLTSCLFAQERGLKALKIDVPVKIDGQLDEPIWKEAAAAEDFILNSPKFGDPASQRSVVKVLYSDQAVYVVAYLYDDPSDSNFLLHHEMYNQMVVYYRI